MIIKDFSQTEFITYIDKQLGFFFPDGISHAKEIADYLEIALKRLEQCINAVKCWRYGEFDYLHSSQYCTFLYYLSNAIYKGEGSTKVCTKLFLLNKALNGIDLFYEIEMPEIFFIGHSVGIVLAKAHYSNYLVLYQNSTVGKNHGIAPHLGEGVIIYPNAAIIGNCKIANGSVIGQGVSVINKNTLENHICYQASEGELTFKKMKHNYLSDFFRI